MSLRIDQNLNGPMKTLLITKDSSKSELNLKQFQPKGLTMFTKTLVLLMCLSTSSLALAAKADGAGSGGGGHNITTCDGKNLMLDEYDINSEKKLMAEDDQRFAAARKDMKKTIAEIATKYPEFAEDLAATNKKIQWSETCQPLEKINDHVSMGEINPIIGQVAIQDSYGNVLVSTQALESYNEDAAKSLKYLFYHETFKALFGQVVDRQALKTVVQSTANGSVDFDRLTAAVNSINPHFLIGDLEIKVVCTNCTKETRRDIFLDPSNALRITLNYHGKSQFISSDNFEASFTIDRSSKDYAWATSATMEVIGHYTLAGPMNLKFYSNGKPGLTINDAGLERTRTAIIKTFVPTK